VKRISAVFVVLAVGCSSPDPRPPDPPPPWGVPISGGTMLITRDGRHAVVADPDRDRVLTADLSSGQVIAEVALPGDEPGRLAEDGAGRIHVALRRGGAIASLDRVTGAVLARRAVCPEPRGIAWSATGDVLHVACTDGTLATFPAAGGDATRRLTLDRDLRDVVVTGEQLVVTRFRTAEMLTLDAQGTIVARALPPMVQRSDFDENTGFEELVDAPAAVAWRAIPLADGRVLVLHQRQLNLSLKTQETGGYGAGCRGGVVEDALTVTQPGGTPFAVAPPLFGALPVDLAVSPAGDTIAVAVAGHQAVHTLAYSSLSTPDDQPCPFGFLDSGPAISDLLGAPTSVAYAPDGSLVIYYPEAPAIVVRGSSLTPRTISLPGGIGYDAGRELFHRTAGVGVACASCHPEGRDDGRVWDFAELGPRRTQSIAGGILARAPYHWIGDQADLHALLDDVFVNRMSGGDLTEFQQQSLGPWLDRIPAPAPIAGDAGAIARGQALFESAQVGCIACHNGPLYTNNQLVNVGTGGVFKVPSLRGVAARPPFLHAGCAPTLLERFTNPCGGGDLHGATSQLTAGELADLVAYVESL
jgi:mono/diheme cytochrome c family protein